MCLIGWVLETARLEQQAYKSNKINYNIQFMKEMEMKCLNGHSDTQSVILTQNQKSFRVNQIRQNISRHLGNYITDCQSIYQMFLFISFSRLVFSISIQYVTKQNCSKNVEQLIVVMIIYDVFYILNGIYYFKQKTKFNPIKQSQFEDKNDFNNSFLVHKENKQFNQNELNQISNQRVYQIGDLLKILFLVLWIYSCWNIYELNCPNVPKQFLLELYVVSGIIYVIGPIIIILLTLLSLRLTIKFACLFVKSQKIINTQVTISQPSQSFVDNIKVVGYDPSIILEMQCFVCNRTYKHDDTVVIMPCKHTFHQYCIDSWIDRFNSCLICQHAFEIY